MLSKAKEHRNLVRAYKSLAKEKEALQASLAALSEKPAVAVTSIENSKPPEENVQDHTKRSEETVQGTEEERKDAEINEVTSLRNKVATLTSTLQTLTDEKNKLELSTKNERKRILDEKKRIEQQLQSDTDNWTKVKKDFETKLHELRSKIIVFQHEREKEATNGIMMLREVESRLSKERNEKEKMEKLLDETQEQNRQFALAIGTRSQEKKQQKQISDLQNELEQVRCRLKRAEQQCKEPPMLKILQDQMEQMKNQYMEAIHQEQKRAEAAESSVRNLSQAHEERVAALEANLSELSFTAANYDRSKQGYIKTIHSLKEKIAELSEENSALNSRKKTVPSLKSDADEENDADTMVKNFVCLWNQLSQLEESKTENCHGVEELLSSNEIIHFNCVEKYTKLEKEFQELKMKSAKENDGTSCQCGLKQQTEELRERIRTMNASSQMTQTMHEHQVSSLREEIQNLRKEHQEHSKHMEQEHRVTVGNLEQQLAEHCQRSLMTLQDRDEEIHRLSKEIYHLNKEAQVQPSTVAAALLSQVNTGGTDGPLLHHLEDLARKELEVSKLRKEKVQLEKSMRDIQMTMIEKQQIMQDTIDDLQEEVDRMKRNASREGENLEYLKNVVLQYMTSVDVESRQMILNAIAAILKFTSKETESVRKCLVLWWWQAPAKNKGQGHRIAVRRPSVGNGATMSSLKINRNRFLSEDDY